MSWRWWRLWLEVGGYFFHFFDPCAYPQTRQTRIRIYRVIVPRSARHRTEEPLLRLILRRVRQRAFVILNPHEIAPVEIAAARLALEKMFGLTNATPVDALAEHRPARSRFIEWHDRCHLAHLTKKSGPGISPEARSAWRGVHPPAASQPNIAANVAPVKQASGGLARARHRPPAIERHLLEQTLMR